MNITVLGQGAMGVRMADRLETAGHTVTRWNRTGATQTPREAVAHADMVIAMLRDDTAATSVWLDTTSGALAGLQPNAVAIESSTLSPAFVAALGRAFAAANRGLIDAPVIGSRPQAEAGLLIHLIGGDAADVAIAQPVLAAMGAAQHHVGALGSGAALKLVVNALFAGQVALMADMLALIHAARLDPAAALAVMGQTPVLSPAAKGAAGLMLAQNQAPLFSIDLVAKDLRYAQALSAAVLPLLAATAARFEAAQAAGLGDRNITALGG
jgi:3-hydroxyisobutyrate dehydrogenase